MLLCRAALRLSHDLGPLMFKVFEIAWNPWDTCWGSIGEIIAGCWGERVHWRGRQREERRGRIGG